MWSSPATADAAPARPSPPARVDRYVLVLMGAWTLVALFSAYWAARAYEKSVVKQASFEAQVRYEEDLAAMRWLTRTGATYILAGDRTAASGNLSGVPKTRSLRGPSDPLSAPASPGRVVHSLFEVAGWRSGTRSRLTRMHPIDPENAPDPWEADALRALYRGKDEVVSVEPIRKAFYLRLMAAFPAEKGCFRCHQGLDTRAGGLRGGISVSVPLAPIRAREHEELRAVMIGHAFLWLCGIAGIGYGGRKGRKYLGWRDRAEEGQRQSEDRYRDLWEHSRDLVCMHDPAGRILTVNPWTAKVLGYAPEELPGMNLRDLLAPGRKDEFDAYMREVLAHGAAQGTIAVRTRSGEDRIWEYNNTLRAEGAKEPVIFGMARDVTERKRAEEALRESTRRLRLAAMSGHWGIWEWDIRSGALIWDERMHELYAVSPEASPKDLDAWAGLLHSEDAGRLPADLREAVRGEREYETEFRIVHPNGKVRILESRGIVVRDSDGRPSRMIGLNADITDHRNLKEQLRQAQKMEAIGRLAGGIAHDFNNLVTVVTGYCELLLAKRTPDDPECHTIEEILKAGNRAALLTRQLLAFSRKQVLKPKVVSLNEIVAGVEKMLRRLIGENILLSSSLDEDPWKVLVDPSQVEQVLMNLAVNSRDAMPDGGGLSLSTANVVLDAAFVQGHKGAKAGPQVLLTVADTGCGMDDETISHIFEPFFTTKEDGRGTGLGLATVYGIVKQSGGYIDVESAVGKGTIFRLYFPQTAQEAADPSRAEPAPGRLKGTETILVVEDERAVRELVVNILSGAGYRVFSAVDGAQGLRFCREHDGEIHLLLSDMMLPGVSGTDLSARVKPSRPGMKVLFMSGYAEGSQGRALLIPGDASFLQKPFKANGLLRKVREAIGT